MSPKDTRNWVDLASLLFPDETVESCGLLSPPLHTVSSSDAERSVQEIEGGTQRESSDQTIDEVLMDRKKSCITLADKIAFVLEFKLQGKGIVGQIVDILIEEFYHNPPVGSANQKLRRSVSNNLYNQNCFKKLGLDPSVSTRYPVWKLDLDAKGSKAAEREKARPRSERGVRPQQNRNRHTCQLHPYENPRSRRAQKIAPIEVHDNGHPISPMLLDSGKSSFQAAFDQWLSYWQSALPVTPDPSPFLSTPVLTLTEAPSTVWSSASLADVALSEFGDIEQSPLFSPVSIALDLAEPSGALQSSPNTFSLSCEASRVPQINQPEEGDDESLVDFDTLMGFGPQSSGPSKPAAFQRTPQDVAPSSALGIEIPLDQLLGFGDSFFLASDSNCEAPALERIDEPTSLIHQQLEANEEIDPSLQLDEWLQELSVSSNPEDTREEAESTTLGADQLLTFDQIMDLIFGKQPTVLSPYEIAEIDSLFGLPPAPDRSTISGNVEEGMNIKAHFEEYLKACGLLEEVFSDQGRPE